MKQLSKEQLKQMPQHFENKWLTSLMLHGSQEAICWERGCREKKLSNKEERKKET